MLNMLWILSVPPGPCLAVSPIAPLCRKGPTGGGSAVGVAWKFQRGALPSVRIGVSTNDASVATQAIFARRFCSGTGAFARSAKSTPARPTGAAALAWDPPAMASGQVTAHAADTQDSLGCRLCLLCRRQQTLELRRRRTGGDMKRSIVPRAMRLLWHYALQSVTGRRGQRFGSRPTVRPSWGKTSGQGRDTNPRWSPIGRSKAVVLLVAGCAQEEKCGN
jgi:hypothetical protein